MALYRRTGGEPWLRYIAGRVFIQGKALFGASGGDFARWVAVDEVLSVEEYSDSRSADHA
jgi:hypothetical protein